MSRTFCTAPEDSWSSAREHVGPHRRESWPETILAGLGAHRSGGAHKFHRLSLIACGSTRLGEEVEVERLEEPDARRAVLLVGFVGTRAPREVPSRASAQPSMSRAATPYRA